MPKFMIATRVAALFLGTVVPVIATGQATVLKVIGVDSVPVPFAWVSVEDGTASITDEKGTVSLGATRHRTLTVTLPRLAPQLAGVTVTGQGVNRQLETGSRR